MNKPPIVACSAWVTARQSARLFLPECDYVAFGSLLLQIRLSSVCSHPLTSVQNFTENPSLGGAKRKTASKIERCHVWVSHLLMSSCQSSYYVVLDMRGQFSCHVYNIRKHILKQ